ncbi:MAG: hypothetical protein R3F54_05330 [Alphaproteobacteria bacterium]
MRGEAVSFTEDGERYLDLVAGSAVTNLGHGLPAHRDAVREGGGAGRLPHRHAPPTLRTERAELYGDLASILPANSAVTIW